MPPKTCVNSQKTTQTNNFEITECGLQLDDYDGAHGALAEGIFNSVFKVERDQLNFERDRQDKRL